MPASLFPGKDLRGNRVGPEPDHRRDGYNLRSGKLRRTSQSPASPHRYRDEPVILQSKPRLPNPLTLRSPRPRGWWSWSRNAGRGGYRPWRRYWSRRGRPHGWRGGRLCSLSCFCGGIDTAGQFLGKIIFRIEPDDVTLWIGNI